MFESVKLKEISKLIGSGITPLRSNQLFWDNGEIPWLKTEQLGEVKIYDTTEKITQYALEKTSIKIFPVNTLSIAMYGEGRTRGNVSILKTPMTTNQACCNIVIDPQKADYQFVYYYLKTQYLQLRSLSSGVRKNLNSNDIKEFEISLPKSLEYQKKIAKVLADLDSKIELNNKINAELEGMAKLIYKYWFVQFDFPFDFAKGKPSDNSSDPKDVKPYKSSGGKMVWNKELKREVPEGWTNGELGDLGSIIGGSTPSKADEENFCFGGVPWITPKDLSINSGKKFITKGEIDASPKGVKNASLKILPKGTVLLSSRAPIGYMVISRNDLTTNQGFKSFVPDKDFSTSFIYYSIQDNMTKIEQNASGSTFREISGSVLKSISICLPSKEIVQAFTITVDSIFIKQNNLELENQQLSSLRDWLLPMLMNGQVRVVDAEEMMEEKLGMVAEGRERYK